MIQLERQIDLRHSQLVQQLDREAGVAIANGTIEQLAICWVQ
jgi:hypothetical protein